MDSLARHQYMIYQGSPAKQLPALAAMIFAKLKANHRCLYLNSPAMVAGIRSYLAAGGLDVVEEVRRGALVLSSDQGHLDHGRFDVKGMLTLLNDAVSRALKDGYEGLWATGDMTWEFGGKRDFDKLLEYESGLEAIFREQPTLGGVCQYHQDTLPIDATYKGLCAHRAVFVNETLSLLNPYYGWLPSAQSTGLDHTQLGEMLRKLGLPRNS